MRHTKCMIVLAISFKELEHEEYLMRTRPKLFYIEYSSTKVRNINLGIRKHNCIFIANYVPKNLPTLESLLYLGFFHYLGMVSSLIPDFST